MNWHPQQVAFNQWQIEVSIYILQPQILGLYGLQWLPGHFPRSQVPFGHRGSIILPFGCFPFPLFPTPPLVFFALLKEIMCARILVSESTSGETQTKTCLDWWVAPGLTREQQAEAITTLREERLRMMRALGCGQLHRMFVEGVLNSEESFTLVSGRFPS